MSARPETGAGAARETLILGGGLTGISAALHLRGPYRLLERDRRLGGLARTEERDGFFFDRTGHWLHLRDPEMQALAERVLGAELVRVARRAQIYSHGVLTPYPFQANLYGLPPEVVRDCLVGMIRAHGGRDSAAEPRNFEEYILHHFGAGIAEHFMVPYNAKLWGVHPREITSAWCSRFVPRPDLEQTVAGAVGAGLPEMGYNVSFVYPRHGGIETFTRALSAELDPERCQLGCAVEGIDPQRRVVRAGGEELPYHAIVSSLPLTALVGLLQEPPAEVVAAASRLRATSLCYLNVALNRPPPADYHWVYVPEPRLPFYRVGIFSNAMPSMAPPGCASLYVELAARGPVAAAEGLIADAVRALVEVKALCATEDVRFAELREIDPAYVIFDEAYEAALAVIHPYLEQQRIFSTGRYGAWVYNAMEDSLLMGKHAAERADALAAGEDR